MIRDEQDLKAFLGRAAVYDEERKSIWYVTTHSSCLIQLDLTEKKIKNSIVIPYEGIINDYSYLFMIKCDDELYLIPYNAQNMYVYRISDNVFCKIELPLNRAEKNKQKKFYNAYYDNEFIYIIGLGIGKIIRISRKSKKSELIYEYTIDKIFCSGKAFKYGDCIYMSIPEKRCLLVFNLYDKTWKEIITDYELGSNASYMENHSIVFFQREGVEVIYDIETKEWASKETEKNQIQYILPVNNQKYVFYRSSFIKCYRNEISKGNYLDYNNPSKIEGDYTLFELILCQDDIIYFQVRMTGEFFELDTKTNIITKLSIEADEKWRSKLIRQMISGKEKINEMDMALKTYVEYVCYN